MNTRPHSYEYQTFFLSCDFFSFLIIAFLSSSLRPSLSMTLHLSPLTYHHHYHHRLFSTVDRNAHNHFRAPPWLLPRYANSDGDNYEVGRLGMNPALVGRRKTRLRCSGTWKHGGGERPTLGW